ncbi:hypothetical protein Q9Q95_19500 [Sphingomonas sp. DG1-23]|uniref:FtsX-like permease family protein n=1 Tax=Sphingomonas sp. DG1-23 TaxID=3068316 RepID=UPI00273D3DC5|nr:FtsX-like permease family protein [Sphingomonas sp. DG1-23]MDP5281119.1 hypothetical protein [Sphingomonas sp. DG1-23]
MSLHARGFTRRSSENSSRSTSRRCTRIQDLDRRTWMFGPFSGVAALLAATGIAGMAIATVERRTKEIGIRKALGARADQVLILSLARLSRPLLWANLIARPCAWWLMRDWLNGFASACLSICGCSLPRRWSP